jgi:hypothetical protein
MDKEVLKDVLKSFSDQIRRWENRANGCERYLALVYKEDAMDLWKVHALMKSGEYRKAKRVASSLDTIVREQIPDEAWDFLESKDGGSRHGA